MELKNAGSESICHDCFPNSFWNLVSLSCNCKDNFYESLNTITPQSYCLMCNSNCKTCVEKYLTSCLSCFENYEIISNELGKQCSPKSIKFLILN